MSSVSPTTWSEANQRWLVAALSELRSILEHALGSPGEDRRPASREFEMAWPDDLAPPALENLCELLALTPFERSVLLLAAGVELDSSIAGLVASIHQDPVQNRPTFGLALSVLPEAHWSALSPERPLRAWRVIELDNGSCLANRPLRLDERVLHHICGLDYLDERLGGLVVAEAAAHELGASHRALAETRPDDRQQSPAELAAQLGRSLWNAARSQARPRLGELAERLRPLATWHDLVLPEAETRLLHQIATQVCHRFTVNQSWGFADKSARGLGISALFAGVSGTGKTMAAEVLANELQLDLYRIDLSQVVSKYIGETEKNLRRVFDEAEEGGAILLFDEADALFGKRSEVKDSHDRYANIEVGYLLQRMEAYRGLAILTTNMKDALDAAFLRRLRFIVHFPVPGADAREAIWRRTFPDATPVQDLDYARLAKLNMAGGNIRNIALHGAFLAARTGGPVTMAHLLEAAHTESAKLQRPLSPAEVQGWQ